MGVEWIMSFPDLVEPFLYGFGCKCICNNLKSVLITVSCIQLSNYIHSVYWDTSHTHNHTRYTCRHHVPVLPHPGITMHNSCCKVLSADKSQRLHLLFIENSSHDESFNKQFPVSTVLTSSLCAVCVLAKI